MRQTLLGDFEDGRVTWRTVGGKLVPLPINVKPQIGSRRLANETSSFIRRDPLAGKSTLLLRYLPPLKENVCQRET
jgi:hypothetical protein